MLAFPRSWVRTLPPFLIKHQTATRGLLCFRWHKWLLLSAGRCREQWLLAVCCCRPPICFPSCRCMWRNSFPSIPTRAVFKIVRWMWRNSFLFGFPRSVFWIARSMRPTSFVIFSHMPSGNLPVNVMFCFSCIKLRVGREENLMARLSLYPHFRKVWLRVWENLFTTSPKL